MQASTSVIPVSPSLSFHSFSNDYAEITDEMSAKLGLGDSESDSVEEFKDIEQKVEEDQEEEEEEAEFSFVFATNSDGSPISAEDAFKDGQIRPIFPVFDRSLLFPDGDSSSSDSASSLRPPLKKLFVEDGRDSMSSDADDLSSVDPGTYCEWHRKEAVEVAASPEMSKKSNSTGFCKLWRFRDLVVRSSSDGKDAFVFLNPNSTKPPTDEAVKKLATENERKSSTGSAAAAAAAAVAAKKKKGGVTMSSAHERHYVRNRAKKEVDKRRSYLPYRPDLVGFFTSVNGLSRNVHPF